MDDNSKEKLARYADIVLYGYTIPSFFKGEYDFFLELDIEDYIKRYNEGDTTVFDDDIIDSFLGRLTIPSGWKNSIDEAKDMLNMKKEFEADIREKQEDLSYKEEGIFYSSWKLKYSRITYKEIFEAFSKAEEFINSEKTYKLYDYFSKYINLHEIIRERRILNDYKKNGIDKRKDLEHIVMNAPKKIGLIKIGQGEIMAGTQAEIGLLFSTNDSNLKIEFYDKGITSNHEKMIEQEENLRKEMLKAKDVDDPGHIILGEKGWISITKRELLEKGINPLRAKWQPVKIYYDKDSLKEEKREIDEKKSNRKEKQKAQEIMDDSNTRKIALKTEFINNGDIFKNYYAGNYDDLLTMDIMKEINDYNNENHSVLNGEVVEKFSKLIMSPIDLIDRIIDAKVLLANKFLFEQRVNELKELFEYDDDAYFYDSYVGEPGIGFLKVTYGDVWKAMEKAEDFINSKKVYKLLRFSLKYYNLSEKIKERKELFNILSEHLDSCVELRKTIEDGDKHLGLAKENDKIMVVSQTELDISRKIGKPFKIHGWSTREFYEGITDNHKQLIRTEQFERNRMEFAAGSDELGFIGGNGRAILISQRELIEKGINPLGVEWQPLSISFKPYSFKELYKRRYYKYFSVKEIGQSLVSMLKK